MNAVTTPVPYRVLSTWDETADTATLTLTPVNGGLARFRPGQFSMLTAFGVGEVPISISGNPVDGQMLVHTLRDVGAVTKALHNVRPGDVVGVRGPFGTEWQVPAGVGGDLLFVAGGIGLAPLRPAICEAIALHGRFGRIVLVVGARTPDDVLFRADLRRWANLPDVEVAVTVDQAGQGWRGNVGLVTSLLGRVAYDPHHTRAFVCGPDVMIRVVARDLVKRGLAADGIRLSLERNMRCGVGHCGHCQLGPVLLCRDGPVLDLPQASTLFDTREL